jgi:hypothetical protein
MLTEQKTRIIKLTKWPELNPGWPTVRALRHLFTNRKVNGFASAFLRSDDAILIDEDEFFRCLRLKNEGGAADRPHQKPNTGH